MTVADAVRVLRARAESYWRDAAHFDDTGDCHMLVAYRTVADELRRVASELDRGCVGLDCDLAGETAEG